MKTCARFRRRWTSEIARRGGNFIISGKNAAAGLQIIEDFYAVADKPVMVIDI